MLCYWYRFDNHQHYSYLFAPFLKRWIDAVKITLYKFNLFHPYEEKYFRQTSGR